MKLFEFIRNYFFVGRNAHQLRTPPIMEIGSADPVVILSETKGLGGGRARERFFAKDAQNDKKDVVILNEVKDLGGGRAQERFFANEAQNDKIKTQKATIKDGFARRVQPRILFEHDDPAYEGIIAARCGMAQDHSLRKGAKERFFVKEAQNDKKKEGFFAREAQNDKIPTPQPPSREGVKEWCGTAQGRSLRMIVLILMLLLVGVRPVGGQMQTRLFLNPAPLLIDTTVSPLGVVSIEVADGVDIFAFDLFVQYDPSLLSVSQVSLGDFLGEGLFCMDQVNDPGLVHYNCTRFGVDTGVSGSGVLLVITFQAIGQGGDTALSLEGSQLYDWPDAYAVNPTLDDGAVSVRPYRTYVPLLFSTGGQR